MTGSVAELRQELDAMLAVYFGAHDDLFELVEKWSLTIASIGQIRRMELRVGTKPPPSHVTDERAALVADDWVRRCASLVDRLQLLCWEIYLHRGIVIIPVIEGIGTADVV